MLRDPLLFLCNFVLSTALLAACNTPAPPPPASPPPTSIQPVNLIRLVNGEWPPYNGSNLPHAGCDSWVIEEAFALEGITVEYDFFPWARGLALSATGQRDGSPSWEGTPEQRIQHYVSAEPTTLQEWVLFHRSDRPLVWKTPDDLDGKIIGVTSGYVYSGALDKLRGRGTATFVENISDEANLRMLLAGRIDVFPVERRVGRYLIRSLFSPAEQAQLVDAERPLAQFPSHLLLSKAVPQNKQRMALFDRGFQRLKESGRYAEILRSCAP